jgi:1,2-phenylacetyl-CoA epoxidase catalytic subunit
MAQPVDEFIAELAADNEEFFGSLAEQRTTYWPTKLHGQAAAEALKTRWFNELRGVDILGRFIGRVPDLTLKLMVARQVADEAKHARLCRRRVEALGSSVLDFVPTREQLAFGDLLDSFAFPEEFFAAQQFTVETQSIKRNEMALRRFGPEIAAMFSCHINPDERFHARLGHLGLQVFARTEVAQARALRAVKDIRKAHVAMVDAHVERMRTLGYLDL